MNRRKAWHALQTRWVSGEPLSTEEERARREYAEGDPLARRELELFDELRSSLRELPPPPPELIGRVLRATRGSPLRLVTDADVPRPRVEEPERARWPLGLRGFALAVLSLALGVLGLFALTRQERREPTARTAPSTALPARLGVRFASVRSELVFTSGRVLMGGSVGPFGAATFAPGERVSIEDGQACFTIEPAIDVCAGANTSLVFESLVAERIVIRVERGTVAASLTKRGAGHVFALVGGDVLATARGTIFAFEHEPAAGLRSVSVLEGSVAVARGSEQPELVPAHSRLTLEKELPAQGSVMGRSEEARVLMLLAPNELWQDSGLGVLELPEGGDGARVLIDGKGPFGLPLSTFVGAGEHRVVWRSPAGDEIEQKTAVELGAARRVPVPAPVTSPSPSVVPATVLLERARTKLSEGDLRGARALYVRLRSAHPRSSEATTVLVTLGKLELELGAPARALSNFELYLRRGGPLAPEALEGKIQALRALARPAEERAAIEQYLTQHGNGLAVPALRKRLTELNGRP